jgi:hypothetical protein
VQEMLGHANASQTRTYLHAAEMGLQESMRRFDAVRGKPLANDPQKEPQPVGHDERQSPSADSEDVRTHIGFVAFDLLGRRVLDRTAGRRQGCQGLHRLSLSCP